MRRIAIATALGLTLVAAAPLAAAATFRLATLAPRNSTWMKYLRKAAREIRKATGGAVKIRFYPDGQMGDEPLMVEKMKLGQLHGAAVTNVGLSKIQPAILVQQLPLLFRSSKELDCLREKMADKFSAMMEEKGFVVLGYGDVGFVYLFANKPLRTPADFADVKMWAWSDDPIGQKIQELAGVTSVQLGVPDVLSSLQTGLINAFYTAPYAAIALQWFTSVKYVVALPLSMAVGAVVVTKGAWETISEEHRKAVREVSKKWIAKLNARIRRDNRRSVSALKKQGIEVIKLTAEERKPWREIAKKVQAHFAGSLYPAELLSEVKSNLRACRSGG
jgi:TRAP-type C4-dicarboxylate transport system substrate-binding protein